MNANNHKYKPIVKAVCPTAIWGERLFGPSLPADQQDISTLFCMRTYRYFVKKTKHLQEMSEAMDTYVFVAFAAIKARLQRALFTTQQWMTEVCMTLKTECVQMVA